MTSEEFLILLFLIPAMFLACPEEPPPSPVLFEPTVYTSPDVDCYPLPSGDQYCECVSILDDSKKEISWTR